ncbi:hypothetical protein HPB48_026429 [Haemaphysalis longicornis]|uniref:CCHC-type domain-containing protein n=1 Tax=Haemaphysalis longicornis TaxID=44386 RepID=A0A9J6H9I3_HAELO|nr:hypothetical protein HPB48_026429 [Haemaphysalis longicornis]
MHHNKGKGVTPHTSREDSRTVTPRTTPDQATGTKGSTALPKPRQSTAQQTKLEQLKKEKKKKQKTKESTKECTKGGQEDDEASQTRKEIPWLSEEEEDKGKQKKEGRPKDVAAKDSWDESTEEEQEEQGDRRLQEPLKRQTREVEDTKTNEEAQREKLDKQSSLSRLSRADKAITKALIQIASLVGDNEKLQEQVDIILTEQVRLKSIIVSQREELAYQKGRICELEKQYENKREEDLLQDELDKPEERKPTYALVVSSGTMGKQEVATLIKKSIHPTDLGLRDATLKPGREGVIITTTSKEGAENIEAHLQRRTKDLQIKRPKENKYPIKVIGIDEQEEPGTIVQTIIEQNNLPCTTADIELKKTWKGKQGTTAIFALNKEGHQALKNRSHLYIGWTRCKVFDHFFLPRCTKCAEHGHSSVDCEAPTRCVRCGKRGHHKDDCRNDSHCHACDLEDREESRDHEMMSWECPVYRDKMDQERRRITARLV